MSSEKLSENALKVLEKRYFAKNEKGEVVEDASGFFKRISMAVAEGSPDVENRDKIAAKYEKYLSELKFLPNTPTLINAGRKLGQLSACFVLPVEDSLTGIFDTVKAAALVHQTGGGCIGGESTIITDRGPILLKELVEKKLPCRVLSYNPKTHEVSFMPVGEYHIVKTARDRIFKIDLGNGLIVRASDWHPFFVWNGKEVVEKRADNLSVGDQVIGAPTLLPERLDDLAWLTGIILSDGSFDWSKNGLRFRVLTSHEKVIERVSKILSCNYHNSYDPRNKSSVWEVSLTGRPAEELFEKIFGEKPCINKLLPNTSTKMVPEWIWGSTNRIFSCLVGFLDGDSNSVPEKAGFEYATINKSLADSFEAMCGVFGIPTRRRKREPKKEHWNVVHNVFAKLSMSLFYKITSFSARYTPDMLKLTYSQGAIPLDKMFFDLLSQQLPVKTKLWWRKKMPVGGIEMSLNRWRTSWTVSRSSAEAILAEIGACDLSRIVRTTRTVKAIAKNESDDILYDLTVPETQTYIAGGKGGFVVVHNTGFSFSRIRSAGSIVKTTGGQASGPISFMKVLNASTDAIKQGGCLHPDTLVFTERGILRLGELFDQNGPEWQNISFNVCTDNGVDEAYEGHVHGMSETLEVTFSNGSRLVGTPEHKIFVLENGKLEWRQLKDLGPRDVAALRMGSELTPSDFVTLSELSREQRTPVQEANTKQIKFPEKLDEELGYFLGYFYGNGFYAELSEKTKNKRIGWTVPDKKPHIKDKLKNLVESLFGVHVYSSKKENDASENFFVASVELYEWFAINGLAKQKSNCISLPKAIRMSPQKVVAAFIRGYFEADGCVSESHPKASSASRRFLEDLQVLLQELGIYSVIQKDTVHDSHYGTSTMWNLTVRTACALKKWRSVIGWREEAILGRSNGDMKNEQHGIFPIPPEVFVKTLDTVKERYGYGVYRALCRVVSHFIDPCSDGYRNPTQGALTRVFEHFGKILVGTELEKMYTELKHLWFVKVSSVVEAGVQPTLDLSVRDRHSYVANGLVTHNTRRGANMGILSVEHPDILEFIDCKQDLTQLTNFNISVAITDKFMEALKNNQDYELVDPGTKTVVKTLSAKLVWDKIVKNARETGEPGLFFIDRANENNPIPSKGEIEATNPCTRGSSLFLTKNGLVPIKDLAGKTSEIWNGQTWTLAKFWSTGVKPVYRLRLKNGLTYEGTLDHRLAALSEKEIKLGNAKDSLFDHFLGKGNWIGQESLSEEEATVFGFLQGDAGFHAVRGGLQIRPSKEDHEVIALVSDYLAKANIPLTQHADGRLYIGKAIRERLRDFGFLEVSLPNRSLPTGLFTQSPKIVKKFLKGLFSANGSVILSNTGRITLKTSCRVMAGEVQQLLSALGYRSNISTNKHHKVNFSNGIYECKDSYDLNISGQSADLFMREIGFIQSYKNEKAALRPSVKFNKIHPSRVESIEYIGEEEVFDFNEPETHWGWISGFKSHNCGEQPLGDFQSCTLSSIDLVRHVKNGQLDWAELEKTTAIATEFLDDVVSVNKFPIPELAEVNRGTRRIGLGIMGFARMLILLGIPYDSEEGLEMAEQVMSRIRQVAERVSLERAQKYGVYPYYEGIGPARRNSHLLTIAPTGTISMIADTSSGCEPEFSLIWFKNVMDGTHLPYTLSLFEETAKREGFWSEDLPAKIVANHGSCRGIPEVPKKWQKVFATAHDIAPEWHVRMQAAFQKHIDAAVSKTINLPREATVEDVANAYLLAYELGCKGITVYRDGSRENQVLNIGESKKESAAGTNGKKETLAWGERAKGNGESLTGARVFVKSRSGKSYVHLYHDSEGRPIEIFVTPATAHEEKESAILLGRLGSLALQYGAPLNKVMAQFVKAHEEAGTMGSDVHMIVKAIGKLNEDIAAKNGTLVEDVHVGKCPECRSPLAFQEGCLKCTTCGFSKC